MTTERRIMLTIVTDDTGTKCAAECPAYDAPSIPCDDVGVCRMPQFIERTEVDEDSGEVTQYHFEVVGLMRHDACIAAESAAREAEVDALRRGFGIATREASAESHDPHEPPFIDWQTAVEAMESEIKRIDGDRR